MERRALSDGPRRNQAGNGHKLREWERVTLSHFEVGLQFVQNHDTQHAVADGEVCHDVL